MNLWPFRRQPKKPQFTINLHASVQHDATVAAAWTTYAGTKALLRMGEYAGPAAQGYLIDKATADKYGITNIGQLREPRLAKLFDNDGDGKADMAGCNPGWGCEGMIEHHMDAYTLRPTVKHVQGSYAALMADTIGRFKRGAPIL